MEFWQTIAATVTGGAITLIATVLTNHSQKKRETDKKKLEKIEKAYMLLTNIEHSYRMAWASDTASLNSGKYEQEYRPNEKLPFDELEMLIGFYAKDLTEEVRELISYSKQEYGKLSSKIIDIDSQEIDEKDALKLNLYNTFDEIKKKIYALQEKLVTIGNDYI